MSALCLRAHNALAQRIRRLPPVDSQALQHSIAVADEAERIEPWWNQPTRASLLDRPSTQLVSVEALVTGAIQHSPQVRAGRYLPLAQQARIIESDSQFDWQAFMDAQFRRQSDPVGNILTTGGGQRFRERNFSYVAGLRKQSRIGGSLEVSQQLGYQANNSQFFIPAQQGNSRLVLSFTQPILRGAGNDYAASRTVLAEIELTASWEEFAESLQQHLVSVTRAYWELFEARAELQQREALLKAASQILADLEGRQSIDSSRSQVIRARSAVASRRSSLARARQDVRNAEARIRMLVNDPALGDGTRVELVPAVPPHQAQWTVDRTAAKRTALRERPEIKQVIAKAKAAAVRLHVAENEILPALDVIVETYAAGLAGRGDIGQAFGNQFQVGEPGYTVGLQLELPLNRRGPLSVRRRRELEWRHVTSQVEAVALRIATEVEVAAGEVDATFAEVEARYHSMQAVQEEVSYLRERWRLLAGEDQVASLVLENLLNAQERLADEQALLARAQSAHMLAMIELQRATGTLLQSHPTHSAAHGHQAADSIRVDGRAAADVHRPIQESAR